MSGPKASHLCITQYNSTILTPSMMDEIYHSADEIVSTRGIGIQYTLVHLKKKASSVSLANALKTLEPIGVKGSEIFGYNTVEGNTPSASEHLENHPGFRTLVDHEIHKNSEFRRWTADGYNPNGLSGYNLLKTRLLANQASESSKSGQAADWGVGGNDGRGANANDDNDEEQRPRPSESDRERTKRRRTASPDGGGPNMVSLDAIMGNVSGMVSAAVASAINSSGSVFANVRNEERNLVQKEQQRREIMENKLKEVEMQQKLSEQRFAEELKAKDEQLSEQQHQVSVLSAKLADPCRLSGERGAAAKDEEIAGLREDMAKAKKTSDSKDEEIAALQAKLEQMSVSKDNEITGLRGEMAKAKQTSDSKDEEITTLSEKYNTLKDECFQTSKDYDKKTTELKAFSCARLQDMQQRCDKLQETSLAKDGEIATLHDQMALLKDECSLTLQHTERQIEERATDAEEELTARRKNMTQMLEGLKEAHTKEADRLRLKVSTAEKKLQNMEAARATQSAETEKLQVGIRFFIDVNKLTTPHLPGASLSRPRGNGAQRERDQDSRA